MIINSSIRGNAGIVAVSGRMDADHAASFEQACARLALADGGGVRHIVADLGGLSYVSSMGLRAFLAIAQERKAAGGELVLVGLAGFVKQVFDLAKRVPTLDGLVLGLLDNNKWNAQKLLRQLEVELRARYSLKEVIYLRKPYFSRPAFPAMIEQLATGADVVVTALAD